MAAVEAGCVERAVVLHARSAGAVEAERRPVEEVVGGRIGEVGPTTNLQERPMAAGEWLGEPEPLAGWASAPVAAPG